MKAATKKKVIGAGAGIAALAAAAAATYYFTGKNGAKNRKKVAGWAAKAKKEVVQQVGELGDVTKKTYDKTVDTVMDQYKNLKDVDKSELLQMGRELKAHWDSISKQIKTAAKPKKAAAKTKAPAKKQTASKKKK